MLQVIGRVLVVLLLLATSAEVAEAQAAEARHGGPLLSVLAGMQGADPGGHLFAGLGAGYLVSPRMGGEGVALLGSGRGYRSALAGGGPSVVVLDVPRAQLRLWGGPGWYRESLAPADADGSTPRATRATAAAMAGLTVRAPVGRVALTGGLVYWAGRLDEAGFQRSEIVHGVRLTVGVAR